MVHYILSINRSTQPPVSVLEDSIGVVVFGAAVVVDEDVVVDEVVVIGEVVVVDSVVVVVVVGVVVAGVVVVATVVGIGSVIGRVAAVVVSVVAAGVVVVVASVCGWYPGQLGSVGSQFLGPFRAPGKGAGARGVRPGYTAL